MILTSVSVGTVSLMLLLLPYLGIVAVGIACVVVETVVSAVLLIRPHWWIKDWTPLPATAGLRGRLSVAALPRDEMVLLGTTIGLTAVGTITLSIGLIHRETSVVLASLLSTGLALVPLALFRRRGQRPRPRLDQDQDVAQDPVDAARWPIEGYDELRVDEILPLLQELDAARLDVVRSQEASRESRPSILARIDLLTSSEETTVPATEPPFPIANYDQLRVVDILPLLAGLDAEALDAVLVREERGAGRSTVISRIGRLRKRAERAPPWPPAPGLLLKRGSHQPAQPRSTRQGAGRSKGRTLLMITAFVLGGGGVLGSAEVGMLQALLERGRHAGHHPRLEHRRTQRRGGGR